MPDKPMGRHGSVLQPSPVKEYAVSQGLRILQPEKLKDEAFIEELRSLQADLQIVVAFRMLPEIVWNMPRLGTFMNPYVRGVFATSVFSGITGSSSGGLRLMYQSLADTFISSGGNLEILHRLTSIAAGGLDTLPHSPGLFLMFSVLGLNHKNAYRHVFACSVAIPVIVVVVATAICVFAGI